MARPCRSTATSAAVHSIDITEGTLYLGGSHSILDNTKIDLGGAGSAFGVLTLAHSVAFGPHLTLNFEGGQINAEGLLDNKGSMLFTAGNSSASTLEAFAGFTNHGTISFSGQGGVGSIQGFGEFDNEGKIVVANGYTATIGADDIFSGGLLSVVNDGTISVGTGARLIVAGSADGSGSFIIGNHGTLELADTVANGVHFAASSVGTLQLDIAAGGAITGAVFGLALGDAIDFTDSFIDSFSLSGKILTVTLEGEQPFNITLASPLAAGLSFQTVADGHGGQELVVAHGPLPTVVHAWTDGTTGDWGTAANWSHGVPDGKSDAEIAGNSTETVTVSTDQSVNVLTLDNANATLAVTAGATLSVFGGVAAGSTAQAINIAHGTLLVGGGETTLDNTTLHLGAEGSQGTLSVLQGTTLTLGPDLTVDVTDGQISGPGALDNEGNISVVDSGATLNIIMGPGVFTNEEAGRIVFGAQGATNVIQANQGGGFENDGSIIVQNGDTLSLFVGQGFNSPAVNNGTISVGTDGHLIIGGELGGDGSIGIGEGGTLELLSGTLANHVGFADGAVGTLQLDVVNGADFTGTLSGLELGDTIDFAGGKIIGFSLEDGTLVARRRQHARSLPICVRPDGDMADRPGRGGLRRRLPRGRHRAGGNSFILNLTNGQTAWLGGSDNESGTWQWVAGPLAGQAFGYVNWNPLTPEPSDTDHPPFNIGEHFLQFLGNSPGVPPGTWNDEQGPLVEPATGTAGYVIETNLAPLANAVSDSLTGDTIDSGKWNVYLPTVTGGAADDASATPTANGVELHDHAYLQSVDGFTPTAATPLHVSLSFTLGDSFDYVAVTDRTDGATESSFGGPANGIEFLANWGANGNKLEILDAATGQFVDAGADVTFDPSTLYDVSITDNGSNQTFTVTDHATGQVMASVAANFTDPAAGNLVTITNREGNDGDHTATVSNVSVSTAYEGTEGSTVTLTGFTDEGISPAAVQSYVITGFPTDATFSEGALSGDQCVISDPVQIAALATTPLTITPPADYIGSFTLEVEAVAAGNTTVTQGFAVTISAPTHWVGASDDWTTGSDWSTDSAPATGTDAVIDAGGTYTVTITSADVAQSLTINAADATVSDQSGGSLALGGALTVAAGEFDLTGGALLAPSIDVANAGSFVGYGTLQSSVHNDGTIEASGAGLHIAGAVTGTGAFTIDDAATLEFGSSSASARPCRLPDPRAP